MSLAQRAFFIQGCGAAQRRPLPSQEENMMTTFVSPEHRASAIILVAGAAAVLLPFVVALSPEKAVAAHLMGLVIAALAAKSIWRAGPSDGLLLTGAGALAIVVPVFAWQMPAGGAWVLPLLGAITAAVGARQLLCSSVAADGAPGVSAPNSSEH
jgi:hypothetical protein